MRVTRYFAFVDLCGFTRYTDAHGDEEAVAVLQQFRTCVREVASEYGVRVAKWLGDGAMFVSTEPWQLVAAVVELEHRMDVGAGALPIRAGMAGGDVILFEGDDYIGGPVNLAARLCDAAEPNQVLANGNLAEYKPDWAEARPVGTRSVPGFVQPIPVVQIALPVTAELQL